MVLAYHAIFGAYGFWLPNDPRGSWSDFVEQNPMKEGRPAQQWDFVKPWAGVDLRSTAKQAITERITTERGTPCS